MKSRWYHIPSIHSPGQGEEKQVGWLELFYDLIYVATFIQLGNALSHTISLAGVLAFAGLLVPLWVTWNAFTFYSNRFAVDDLPHRGLVFIQMFAIGGMAVSVAQVFEGNTRQFALFYAATRVVVVLFYLRTYWTQETARDFTLRFALGYSVGFFLWALSLFLPSPWVYVCWGLAVAIDLLMPLNRVIRGLVDRYPPDMLHLSERYGLLTLIVLGESFVKVLSSLSLLGDAVTGSHLLTSAMGLAMVSSLWWIYFDDVAGSRVKSIPLAGFVWVYAHIPMTIAVVATGVSIKKAVFFDLSIQAPEGYRWLLCGSLALVFFAVAAIDAVTERQQSEFGDRARTTIRVSSALFLLLLAPVGAFMPAWIFLLTAASTCVLQVVFDLIMAPLMADEELLKDRGQNPFRKQTATDTDADNIAPSPVRADFRTAIRRGTPNELRHDLYFHLMDGSWWLLFGTFVFLFLFSNAVFAGLYLLEPNSISGGANQSFGDAFFFSVQTMSTIGYGTLSPVGNFADTLVTVEAIFGIAFTAMATGLIFAKVSRPGSSILFSEPILLTTYDGKPTLSFRVGNARGNEIVEANISVVVFVDTVTAEGQVMGRMRDLKLTRSHSPLFMFSWQIFHTIDAESPLHGADADTIGSCIRLLIVSTTGHDSTYGQTVHGRKIYYPEDFVFDHQFVDVITRLDDGRIQIDYTRFHQTTSEDEVQLPPE